MQAFLFALFTDDVLVGTIGAQHISNPVMKKCVIDGAFLGVFLFRRHFLNRGSGIRTVEPHCYYLHRIANVTLVHGPVVFIDTIMSYFLQDR